MTKRHRAASPTSRSILAAMLAKPPLTCMEIGEVVGLNHRHVRQVMKTIVDRGDAFLLPDTFPGRYSLSADSVYDAPEATGWEEFPPMRIHRPVGTWETGHSRVAAVASVFSLGVQA